MVIPQRTVISGGHVVTLDGDIRADLIIDDHEIVAMLADAEGVDADETIDASGLLLLPGGVEPVVPAPWLPAADRAEVAIAAQRASVAGGVTSMAADPGRVAEDSGTQANLSIDAAIWMPVAGDVVPTAVQISRMVQTGIVGLSASISGSRDSGLSPIGFPELHDVMKTLGKTSVPIAIAPRFPGMPPREAISERLAVATLLTLAETTGAWVHLTGVSTADAMQQVVDARNRGVRVTASVPALHLALDDSEANRSIRVRTPLRSRAEIDELWPFVLDESVDCVGLTPYTRAGENSATTTDVQTALSLFWDEAVNRRGMSRSQAIRQTSANAAHILGLFPKKGSLRIGADADVVLFDPNGTWSGRHSDALDGTRWSPIDGREVTGFVVRTLLRGRTVYDADRHDEPLLPAGAGSLLGREDAG